MQLWCRLSDSNQPPTDYKSVALPDELKRQHHYNIISPSLCQSFSYFQNNLSNIVFLEGIPFTFLPLFIQYFSFAKSNKGLSAKLSE